MKEIDFVTEKGIVSGYSEKTPNYDMIGPELTAKKYMSVMQKALKGSEGRYNNFDISEVGPWTRAVEKICGGAVSFLPCRRGSVALFVKASPNDMFSVFEELLQVNLSDSPPDEYRLLDGLPTSDHDFGKHIDLKSLCRRRNPVYLYLWWD